MSIAIIAVAVLRVIEIILRVIEIIVWCLAIAAAASAATALAVGIVMAWRSRQRRAAVTPASTWTANPVPSPAREVARAVTGPGKSALARRFLQKIAAEAGGPDRIQIIVIDPKNTAACPSCDGTGQQYYQARDGEYVLAACSSCGNGLVGSKGTGMRARWT